MKILVINLGATSTKIAVFSDSEQLLVKNLKHSSEELNRFEHISDQYHFRKELSIEELKSAGFAIKRSNSMSIDK